MPSVFICYRRNGASHAAGRLHDDLEKRYGGVHVFRDVRSIDPTVEWKEAIRYAVRASDCVLVFMGRDWHPERLSEPEDPIRFELETAREARVPIMPILVNGSTMPSPEELPEFLRWLPALQAATLRDADYRYDVRRIFHALAKRPLFWALRWPRWIHVSILILTLAASAGFLGAGIFELRSTLFEPDARLGVGAILFLGLGLFLAAAGRWLSLRRRLPIWGLNDKPALAMILPILLALVTTAGGVLAYGSHQDAKVKGIFPDSDLSMRITWKLFRIQNHDGFRTVEATQEGATSLLSNIGLEPQPAVDSVSAEIEDDYWVTIWWKTYGQSDKYGVRHGRGEGSYFGSQETYFEIPE